MIKNIFKTQRTFDTLLSPCLQHASNHLWAVFSFDIFPSHGNEGQ